MLRLEENVRNAGQVCCHNSKANGTVLRRYLANLVSVPSRTEIKASRRLGAANADFRAMEGI